MVNHFATLLANIDLSYIASVKKYRHLSTNTLDLGTQKNQKIVTDLFGFLTQKIYKYSVLIARNYTPVNLPHDLASFYNLLFPENCSNYYKLFLLYSYLRLIDATDRKKDILIYDKRISYDINSIEEYFRFDKKSKVLSSNPDFQLLLNGTYTVDETVNNYKNDFIVYQLENTRNLLVYSTTQQLFYKKGEIPSKNPTDMSHVLSIESGDNLSQVIDIFGTGLSFRITGPLPNFMVTANKRWGFSVENSFKFDFNETLKNIEKNTRIVDNMFNYNRNKSNLTYERIWQMHYNDMYRLAGLLLAYVEKVNTIWQNVRM